MALVTGWLKLNQSANKPLMKYAFLGFSMLIVMVILSVLSLGLVKYIVEKNSPDRPTGPIEIISMVIENSNPDERLVVVNEISVTKEDFPLHIYIVDEKNNILSPYKERDQNIVLNVEERSEAKRKKRSRRGLFLPIHIGRRPPRPPHDLQSFKRRLSGSNGQYLVFVPKERKKNKNGPFFLGLAALLISLFLGIICTIIFMILIFRKQTRSMDRVIEKLKKGDLKARVEIGKLDELSQSKIKFNQMAEEIENLVNSLRRTEASRKTLMSELAHDLRTPIASLKSILEIILERRGLLDESKVESLLETSVKEVDYFSMLVDDLLFLGQVNLPQYKKENTRINVNELIDLEASDIGSRYEGLEIKVNHNRSAFLKMDKKLLTRLVRNALENTCSFAKRVVSVCIDIRENGSLVIRFEDDGKGFSSENLESFGKKKFSREMRSYQNKRISIGLGSVIMMSIVDSYNGTLVVKNKIEDSEVKGAILKIIFPKN